MKICGEAHEKDLIPHDWKQKLGEIPQLQVGGLLKARREQLISELIHAFTNTVTAVIGYGELVRYTVQECRQARAWLEKVGAHTRQLGSLLNKLIDLEWLQHGGQP